MTKEKDLKQKEQKTDEDNDDKIIVQIQKREAANAALKKMLEELEKKRKNNVK